MYVCSMRISKAMSNLALFSWFFLSPSIYCFFPVSAEVRIAQYLRLLLFSSKLRARGFQLQYFLIFPFSTNPFPIDRAISIPPIYVQSNSTLQLNSFCTALFLNQVCGMMLIFLVYFYILYIRETSVPSHLYITFICSQPPRFLSIVEGLYCKRPIQCLASSEILTPTPSPPGQCVSPAFGEGGGHTRWVERGWGINSSEDARHCSVLYTVGTLCSSSFRR